MNKIKVLVLSSLLVGVLVAPTLGFAQGAKSEAKTDLKISAPILLPTSPFYFIKEFGRAVQTFLTFNAEKKAELKLRIADEKLMEAQIVSEKQPDNQKGLEKALANYEENRTELKARLEKLQATSKNPNISDLVQKIDEKIADHTELFNQLTIKAGGAKQETFTGFLEAYGSAIQMWGTHKISVEEMVCPRSTDKNYPIMAPCVLTTKVYSVKAANDKVLAELQKYEDQRVTIKGTATYMNLEGGFWGIVAEEVMVPISNPGASIPEVSTKGSIKVISPNGGEVWKIGQTYEIKWEASPDLYGRVINISLKDSDLIFKYWFPVNFSSPTISVENKNGSYLWKVPEKLVRPDGKVLNLVGGTYFLLVDAIDISPGQHQVINDQSDASFNIVPAKYVSKIKYHPPSRLEYAVDIIKIPNEISVTADGASKVEFYRVPSGSSITLDYRMLISTDTDPSDGFSAKISRVEDCPQGRFVALAYWSDGTQKESDGSLVSCEN